MFVRLACIFCFLFQYTLAQQRPGVFNQPVLPGPDGTFIYTWDSTQADLVPVKDKVFIVSKDQNGTGRFKKIASVQFPPSSEILSEKLGPLLLTELLQQSKLRSAEDLYALLSAGKFDTLGFYLMNTDVLSAIGVLYFDKTEKNNPGTGYQLEVEKDGVTHLLFRKYLRDITYTPFPEFKKYSMSATDSSVSCTWYAVKGKGVFANVIRAGEASGNSVRQFIYHARDTLFVSYTGPAKPGEHCMLYAVPVDMAGNFGRASDTIRLIAFSMTDAVALKNVAVSDTLGGMLLTWDKLPEKKWCAGIRVSKSRSAMENYVVADTLPPDAVSWTDRKVIGGTVYYYRVEPVLYDLPNKPNATPVLVNGEKKFVSGKMIAPQGLRISLTSGKDVRLSWKPDAALNLFGYYVLRGASLQNMEVISPVVRDTIYVDSLKNLNPGDTYLYALAARDMNMEWSDTSETVTVVCPVNEAVTAPAGLSARYTEHGVRLIWNDVSLADEKVIGYIIYKRKKGDEYFRPLMQHPWQDHIYTDTLIDDVGTYEYGCASMDARGNQSILSSLATVDIPGSAYLYPPAGFDLENSPAGVIVTIPPSVNAAKESSYVVYKRAAEEKQFRKTGSVPVGRLEFVDKQVKTGTLYVYAVSLVRSGSESAMSAEKTIRCR
ncbi:hypothetical protein [Agriterribacter sp.]|uniref:fibronectin type III domain-containing protein n=1 Tax=Agriterribacter sp. TaxID=2821509 RepID=UPI002C6BA024|nr:hypothetical protein [Agriterribacter sp.]HRP56739.1 hypothetical protein [Agriterribacter sp.]